MTQTYTSVFGGSTIPPSEYAYREVALTADVSLSWPDNSSTEDTVAALMNVTATGGAWSITLPGANEVSTGRDFVARNVGALSFTIKDNAGGALATIAAGESRYFYVTVNGTAAGTWSVFTYGTGTSSADAASLDGYGLAVLSGVLNVDLPILAPLGNSTLAASDRAQFLVYQGGTSTIYLPAPSSIPNGFFCGLSNMGTGTLTLDASTNAGLVDEVNTKALQPGESCLLVGSSSAWFTLGYGRSAEFEFTQLSVDASVGGTAAITITSAQAANKLWYFYNTASGDRNVSIPAVASVYFVRVGAIGAGNDLTFTTGSGSTVSLSANQSYTIYCDGTNVVSAQTVAVASNVALDDGSASTPSLAFSLDTDTGIYRSGTNVLGIAAGGTVVATFNSSGVTLTNPLSIASGGTGATSDSAARTALGLAIGTNVQAADADLTALAGLSTAGMIARTGSGTAATRTITAPAAGITVTNGDGVAGNPTLALANDLAALEGLATSGVIIRTGDGTATTRSIAVGSNKISVSNGDGIAANPTLDAVEANFTLDNIGGTLGIAKGGTGQTAQTAAFDALAPTTTKGDLIVHNGTDNIRVGVGSNDYVLVADTAVASGVTWKSAVSLGAISLGANVATMLATPTKANFDSALSDDNFAYLATQQAFTKPQRPSLQAETAPSSNTITWDLTDDTVYQCNLNANITTFNLTGTLSSLLGYQYQFVVRYNGGTTISWNSNFKWPSATAPTLTGTSGRLDIFTFVVASTDGGTTCYLVNTGKSQNLGG